MLKYIDEFRNKAVVKSLSNNIKKFSFNNPINIMEICGGHTITILKFGLKDFLPDFINLKSGPGCPVCVTSQDYIDNAISISDIQQTIITTFGDMMKVPGSKTNLLKEKSNGKDIRICLSPIDAVDIAKKNPDKNVIFLGIGFETTAPTIGASIQYAYELGLKNFSVLCSLKTMPAAMAALMNDNQIKIDAFICPGHVTTITGLDIYKPISDKFKKPCVVTGFEPTDMLSAIEIILKQISSNKIEVANQYTRVVKNEGNVQAQKVINDVFEESDANWRGIGVIKKSGLSIKNKYKDFDALNNFEIKSSEAKENPLCICGDILRSLKTPDQCKLFAKTCTPENPIGSCMVSYEGTCGVYYKYRENIK